MIIYLTLINERGKKIAVTQTELRMASNIQDSVLPAVFPPFPEREEIDLYASMDPAREIGGDFYDFFLIDEQHLAVLIADVSDKGAPAALFMMSAKNLINYRAHQGGTPGEIITDVSAHIARDNKYGMFITIWMGILDLTTGVMVCTNAGHEYPAIKTPDGDFEILKSKGKASNREFLLPWGYLYLRNYTKRETGAFKQIKVRCQNKIDFLADELELTIVDDDLPF